MEITIIAVNKGMIKYTILLQIDWTIAITWLLVALIKCKVACLQQHPWIAMQLMLINLQCLHALEKIQSKDQARNRRDQIPNQILL